jgi:integrase
MALTDAAIRGAKATSKTRKLSDGGGLQLWITPSGGKLWHLAYRFNGKQKKLAMGAYPGVSLADARARRDEAKSQLASGIDPGQQKALDKLTKANSEANTFGAVAAELVEKKRHEGKAPATLGKLEWLFSLVGDTISKRPVAEVTAPELLDMLRKVEARGNRETAKRLRAVSGEVFRYAIATGRATTDPTSALRGALLAPVTKHRAALLDPVAVGGLMRAIEGFKGQPSTVAALKLMAYLFPRPGELRQAEWREFDLDGAIWTVPASRMKMRRPHQVPLPKQAVEVLRELRAVTGYGALVFPGVGMSGGVGRKVAPKPISENTLNGALRRMGFGPDEMTAHGFRATASTVLNESGKFSVDAIERALAHQDEDAVRRAYARGAYWQERVTMAQWYADHLDALRDGAKVIAFARAND